MVPKPDRLKAVTVAARSPARCQMLSHRLREGHELRESQISLYGEWAPRVVTACPCDHPSEPWQALLQGHSSSVLSYPSAFCSGCHRQSNLVRSETAPHGVNIARPYNRRRKANLMSCRSPRRMRHPRTPPTKPTPQPERSRPRTRRCLCTSDKPRRESQRRQCRCNTVLIRQGGYCVKHHGWCATDLFMNTVQVVLAGYHAADPWGDDLEQAPLWQGTDQGLPTTLRQEVMPIPRPLKLSGGSD